MFSTVATGKTTMTDTRPQLVWFRSDLRIHDNPALSAACASGQPVMAVVFITPQQWQQHGLGERKTNLLQAAMQQLQTRLASLNIPLLIEEAADFNRCRQRLLQLLQQLGCQRLFLNNEYEVNERRRDILLCREAAQAGIDVQRFHDQCLLPPGSVLTQSGQPFRVFTPFKRAWLQPAQQALQPPLAAPLAQPPLYPELTETLLQTAIQPDTVADSLWSASELDALQQLDDFVEERGRLYKNERDFPALDHTSRLSVALSLGLISPRQCLFAAVQANAGQLDSGNSGLLCWINELVWREFYRHLLVAFPALCKHQAFKPETDAVIWRHDDDDFNAWCEGRTGYPIVDAAQRQLLQQGWMHNRLRMISAMFLTKHLLIDWRLGEAFFSRHLLDADLASNNGGWQWSASTGADGAPWFRIFNPLLQSQKFDAEGEFIGRYVPELAALPAASRHNPDALQRRRCGYPQAIVEHAFGRQRALDAFAAVTGKKSLPSAQPELQL
jgi:deoxyribodipyrimidine photo-lyase